MRNYDNWNRYLDNSGKTLSGCVQFMVKDGTTSAPIFDSDTVALENPQITDIYGRTEHQVFVDSDVLAYFYKYIGQGTLAEEVEEGIDTSDESKWSLQYTVESMDDLIAHVRADSLVPVGTMTELRAINPELVAEIDGLKVVQLLGYNEIGDKEPVVYVWNPESEVQDDGGAIIKADDLLTGRWLMVKPTEHCDCRHFGIFPTNSSESGTDYATELGRFFSYCNTARIRPYFSATGDYKYYFYNNLNATSNEFIDVANGVVFEDLSNSSFNCPGFNGDPYFDNALTAIVNCNTVKTSWNPRTIISYDKVILDADIRERVPAFTNAEIDVQYSPCVGYTFTNCKLSETRSLGTAGDITNSYNNCVLTERMFITSGDQKAELAGHVTNCQFDIDDWKNNIDMWKAMRCTADTNCAFDYRNYANVGSPWGQYSGNTLTGSILTVTNLINPSSTQYAVPRLSASRIVFDNCEGNYLIEAGVAVEIRNCRSIFISVNGSEVNIKSSSVAISTAGTGSSVYAYDSTVSFESNKNLVNFNTKNCTIVASNNSTTVTCQNFSLYSGILMCPIECEICVLKDSQINKPVTSKEYKANVDDSYWTINAFIDNCIFNDRHVMTPTNSPVKVLGTWTNNIGNVPNPITIGRSSMYEDDTMHSYTYRGNSGTMEMASNIDIVSYIKLSDYPIDDSDLRSNEGLPGYVICCPDTNNSDNYRVLATTLYQPDGTGDYYDDPSRYFGTAKFFTIGTVNCRVNVDLYLEDRSSYFSHTSDGYIKYGNPVAGNTMLRSTDGTESTANCSVKYDIAYDFTLNVWKIKNLTISDGSWNNLPSASKPFKLHIVQV